MKIKHKRKMKIHEKNGGPGGLGGILKRHSLKFLIELIRDFFLILVIPPIPDTPY